MWDFAARCVTFRLRFFCFSIFFFAHAVLCFNMFIYCFNMFYILYRFISVSSSVSSSDYGTPSVGNPNEQYRNPNTRVRITDLDAGRLNTAI